MTQKSPGRKALHAFVTDAAHAGWHDTAAERFVSTSALLEALGLRLAEGQTEFDLTSLVQEAQKIDRDHRRRRP